MKAMPWMRMWWLAQIVMAGIQELAPAERKQARELASKLARERRLSRRDREHLSRLAKKVGKGAARGARGRKRR
jgi:hypothetical protein